MENITLEQIDLIMQRANVSYAEAKEALEQCGSDTVEALLLLEKNQKIKPQPEARGTQVKGFISRLHSKSFIISKDTKTLIDIPLTIAILIFVFSCHISVLCLILAIIFGYKVDIKSECANNEPVHSSVNLMKE